MFWNWGSWIWLTVGSLILLAVFLILDAGMFRRKEDDE